MLMNTLGWLNVEKKTGIVWEGYTQMGVDTNNTFQRGNVPCAGIDSPVGCNGAEPNNAGGPVADPSDTNYVEMEQSEMFIHRNVKGNIVSGITPTPAPMYKKFDWGFMSDTVYGRVLGCLMNGFDVNWSMNPSGANDTINRANYLCEPNAFVDLYIPVLKGIVIHLGRFDDVVSNDETPTAALWGPDIFFSRDYTFYRDATVLGGRVSAMIFHSHTKGYLMADYGMNSGLKTTHSLNGGYMSTFALHYRTPKMDTWIDYQGRVGPGSVKTNATAVTIGEDTFGPGSVLLAKPLWVSNALANYHVFSPNNQLFFENNLIIQKEFRPHWKVTAQVAYGKQFGDGSDTNPTYATYNPAAVIAGIPILDPFGLCEASEPVTGAPFCRIFKGASFLSYEGQVTYTVKPNKLNFSMRAEEFRNPNGFFGGPVFAVVNNAFGAGGESGLPPCWGCVKGAFNDISWGLNYAPIRMVRIRPEVRYDWQSGNYLSNAFGQLNPGVDYAGQTSSTQFFAGVDALIAW